MDNLGGPTEDPTRIKDRNRGEPVQESNGALMTLWLTQENGKGGLEVLFVCCNAQQSAWCGGRSGPRKERSEEKEMREKETRCRILVFMGGKKNRRGVGRSRTGGHVCSPPLPRSGKQIGRTSTKKVRNFKKREGGFTKRSERRYLRETKEGNQEKLERARTTRREVWRRFEG